MPDAKNHPTPAELTQQSDALYQVFIPAQRWQNACLGVILAVVLGGCGWILWQTLRAVWGVIVAHVGGLH